MSIQKEFVMRFRSAGHVRFQIPVRICSAPFSSALGNGIAAIAGVYRVRIYTKQAKLSIRFDESVCAFKQLAIELSALLKRLEQQPGLTETLLPIGRTGSRLRVKVGNKLKHLKVSQWLSSKYSDAKETVHAAKVITKLGMKAPKGFVQNPEKAVIDFLNDILVLYLIKLHWKRVIQLWLPNPLKYRYEWLAVIYLFYLLMRTRKPQQ